VARGGNVGNGNRHIPTKKTNIQVYVYINLRRKKGRWVDDDAVSVHGQPSQGEDKRSSIEMAFSNAQSCNKNVVQKGAQL